MIQRRDDAGVRHVMIHSNSIGPFRRSICKRNDGRLDAFCFNRNLLSCSCKYLVVESPLT